MIKSTELLLVMTQHPSHLHTATAGSLLKATTTRSFGKRLIERLKLQELYRPQALTDTRYTEPLERVIAVHSSNLQIIEETIYSTHTQRNSLQRQQCQRILWISTQKAHQGSAAITLNGRRRRIVLHTGEDLLDIQ